MTIIRSEKLEADALEMGASLMALSARTAPKTRGVDSVKTMVLTGKALEQLAVAMEKKAKDKSVELPTFKRDAGSV
ncbi:MAG TPA: ferredoxin, partial [Thermodesulfobacteriota bacterium]|nr:ferredoxin [Thermodesulfobacteriota bacterium]